MGQENVTPQKVPDTLPEIFEAFGDARRAGFIAAMGFKQNGGKLA